MAVPENLAPKSDPRDMERVLTCLAEIADHAARARVVLLKERDTRIEAPFGAIQEQYCYAIARMAGEGLMLAAQRILAEVERNTTKEEPKYIECPLPPDMNFQVSR